MEQIALDNISKKYNGNWVLRDLNHTFHQGESVAFVGHNGCGKSTLLKIIAGLVAPTTGEVRYGDKLHFSYVPEKFPSVNLSARRFLMRMCEMDGMKSVEICEKINDWAEEFSLSEMLDFPMKFLSKGSLQKVGIIQALMTRPEVLLLDEPLSGQDMKSQRTFVQKVNALRGEGTTVFISCHESHLVKALAETIYTIQDGNVIPYKIVEEVNYIILLNNPRQLPMVHGMEKYGSGYKLQTKEKNMESTVLYLLQSGWHLKGVYEVDGQDGQISVTGLF